jgi:hypothetical protein
MKGLNYLATMYERREKKRRKMKRREPTHTEQP